MDDINNSNIRRDNEEPLIPGPEHHFLFTEEVEDEDIGAEVEEDGLLSRCLRRLYFWTYILNVFSFLLSCC